VVIYGLNVNLHFSALSHPRAGRGGQRRCWERAGATPGPRTIVYQAQKKGRVHEVEIEIADGRVTEIERRVYRLGP